jgi:hypothetical protein
MEISLEARHFYKFLKKHNCLRQFIKNILAENKCINKKWSILEILTMYNTISVGFIWVETEEGVQYWDELNNKWINERKRREEEESEIASS